MMGYYVCNNMFAPVFLPALNDYALLLDKGYPSRPSLQLVGNRYRLSGDERNALYRGASSSAAARRRNVKRDDTIRGRNLYIDGYNVLYTIYNYLTGRPVFISSDSYLRDTGGSHGRIANPRVFSQAMQMLQQYVHKKQPQAVSIYLDKAVRRSGRHKQDIDGLFSCGGISFSTELVPSADKALLESDNGVIATSDSVIIDRTQLPVADLPRIILSETCGADFFDFTKLLHRIG